MASLLLLDPFLYMRLFIHYSMAFDLVAQGIFSLVELLLIVTFIISGHFLIFLELPILLLLQSFDFVHLLVDYGFELVDFGLDNHPDRSEVVVVEGEHREFN